MAQLLSDLQSLCIANTLAFEEGPGGLLRAAIFTPHAEATVYLHGAHVTHYRPVGQKPLLFLSDKSQFDPTKPIRGGIPICFPWFGPRSGGPSSPMHGFARVRPWVVESTVQAPDKSVTIIFRLDSTEATRALWPVSFTAWYRVTIGPSLGLALEVHNTSAEPFTFEEALHTYFSVGDIRQLAITGLADAAYVDRTDGMKRKTQDEAPIAIAAETDRTYLDSRTACFIDDPAFARRISIEKTGSDTTVLWNPWIAKAKAMPDFGDDEWTDMLCIESANAGANAVALAPDRRHSLSVRYTSEPR
jgi:glucose-6-phosphate 1-epimerase